MKVETERREGGREGGEEGEILTGCM